ncbi:MAG: PilT protein domain protein [Patescibacteria group bacterium]|nr:PilT protein domain protein [Patescibacteria group bacterium]
MRVLFDTNILIKILARRGELLVFRNLLLHNEVAHITSEFILDETERVLVEALGLTKQKAKAATRALAKVSEVVTPTTIEQICRDPSDDHILAAAIAGRVDYLVTADQDLLVLGEHKGIRIMTMADFKQVLKHE